jgi:hypothetical protein
MLPAEREHARVLIYEVLPSRYGMNVHHLRSCRRDRADGGTGRQARAPGACSSAPRSRARSPRRASCRRAWTSGAPRGTPTGSARTT